MKVVCEAEAILPNKVTRGKIIEVLGDPSRPDVAIQGIIRSYGLSERFPATVEAETENIPDALTEDMIRSELLMGRKDLRTMRTMTIDGLDAKDLDDAISFEQLPDGRCRLYVHIADVTHYVREDSAIDSEARKRGTSVYLVDRVLPMLPPKLSNGICSLNPGHDRLALTVAMVFNPAGEMLSGDVFESVIRSDVRGNYDDVWQMIESGEVIAGYETVFDDVLAMHRLSRKLRQRRLNNGSLNFDFPETKIDLDDMGSPLRIYPQPNTEANELIEEFMIAANIFVAQNFDARQAPFIYRIHEEPDAERLERFYTIAKRVGLMVHKPKANTPQELSVILEKKKHEFPLLSQLYSSVLNIIW